MAASADAISESHIRVWSSHGFGIHKAVNEVIEIAREAEIAAHITHIKVLGNGVWGESSNIVDKIVAARAEGLAITADQNPGWLHRPNSRVRWSARSISWVASRCSVSDYLIVAGAKRCSKTSPSI